MSTNLAQIRAKLQKMDDARKGKLNFSGDGTLYPFWNIDNDSTAVIRFLPDKNEDNSFFWVEKQMIKLPFPGIKGHDETKPVIVQVPCVEMWGDTCPVLTEVRPMFNDDDLKDLARKYWKKRSYIFQGFVQSSPLVEENPPENPIRKFAISPQLFNIIKSALMDPELEELPIDYTNGVDFRITKTKKGEYADYSTSKYARKESALTEEQLEAIETHGLVNLNEYLPKRPNNEELNAIYEMFQASLEGELYDPDKWGEYYRPFGFDFAGSKKSDGSEDTKDTKDTSNANDAPAKVTSTTSESDSDKSAESNTSESSTESESSSEKSVDDILKIVRSRSSS